MTVTSALDLTAAVGTAVLIHAGLVGAPAAAPLAPGTDVRVIDVTAKRFAFEPARIEVDEGETVRLVVTSLDGVHGMAIKKLKVAETIPRGGEPVIIEFTAPASGEFEIVCSEYCGKGHDMMKGALVVRAQTGGR